MFTLFATLEMFVLELSISLLEKWWQVGGENKLAGNF